MKNYTGKAPLHQKWADKDFLADTMHMHWLARMFYDRLLHSACHISTRPDLPDEDDQLRKILGGVPKEVWDEHREAVRAMFTVEVVNGVNVLFQKRLREDWQTVEDYRKQQSGLAKRKWDKRGALSHFDANPMPRQSQGNAKVDVNALPPQCEGNAKAEGSQGKPCQEEEEGEGMAHPAHLARRSSTEQKLLADMEHISDVCYELTDKPPNPDDVRNLLNKYPASDIESALREYVGGVNVREIPYAELAFFGRGGSGAETVIRVRRERESAESSQRSNVVVE